MSEEIIISRDSGIEFEIKSISIMGNRVTLVSLITPKQTVTIPLTKLQRECFLVNGIWSVKK